MATKPRQNEDAIEAFKQAQARLGLPAILTRDCAKVRDDAHKQIGSDFAAAIDRIKENQKTCLDGAQQIFDMEWNQFARPSWPTPGGCYPLGGDLQLWMDGSACDLKWKELNAELDKARTQCITDARDENAAALKDMTDRSLQVSLDYAMCCINNPGSCNSDAGTPM